MATIPKFKSVDEADAWFAEQEKIETAKQLWSLSGPCWAPGEYRILYSTVRVASGKFGVGVFHAKDMNTAVYYREFAKRKDARARALALYEERRPRR